MQKNNREIQARGTDQQKGRQVKITEEERNIRSEIINSYWKKRKEQNVQPKPQSDLTQKIKEKNKKVVQTG